MEEEKFTDGFKGEGEMLEPGDMLPHGWAQRHRGRRAGLPGHVGERVAAYVAEAHAEDVGKPHSRVRSYCELPMS